MPINISKKYNKHLKNNLSKKRGNIKRNRKYTKKSRRTKNKILYYGGKYSHPKKKLKKNIKLLKKGGAEHQYEELGSGKFGIAYKTETSVFKVPKFPVGNTLEPNKLKEKIQSDFNKEIEMCNIIKKEQEKQTEVDTHVVTILETRKLGENTTFKFGIKYPQYIELELCEKIDLKKFLDTNINNHLEKKLQYFKEIYNGISWLHSIGIIHSDLHTGNVIICKEKATLTDFGLSRVTSSGLSTLISSGAISSDKTRRYFNYSKINPYISPPELMVLQYNTVLSGKKNKKALNIGNLSNARLTVSTHEYTDYWAFGIMAISIFTDKPTTRFFHTNCIHLSVLNLNNLIEDKSAYITTYLETAKINKDIKKSQKRKLKNILQILLKPIMTYSNDTYNINTNLLDERKIKWEQILEGMYM
jgi:serine/threonine protein kinase